MVPSQILWIHCSQFGKTLYGNRHPCEMMTMLPNLINLWYYLSRGHLIAVQEAPIVRHEMPVIISFRRLKRHDGNGDFLGYGCLLHITNDTPRRCILYRIVYDVSVRHTFSRYRLGLGALSGYFCHSVLGLWNLGEKRFPSSNNIPLFSTKLEDSFPLP